VLITQNILPHNTSSCVSKPSTSPLTSIPRGKKEIYVAPQKALRAQAQSIPVLDQRTELQVLGLGEMGKGMRMRHKLPRKILVWEAAMRLMLVPWTLKEECA
jgi:hypothetical protein